MNRRCSLLAYYGVSESILNSGVAVVTLWLNDHVEIGSKHLFRGTSSEAKDHDLAVKIPIRLGMYIAR